MRDKVFGLVLLTLLLCIPPGQIDAINHDWSRVTLQTSPHGNEMKSGGRRADLQLLARWFGRHFG